MEFKWGCNIHGRVEGNIELVRVACCVLSFRSAGCFDMCRFGTHAVWLRKEKTHASSPSSLSSPSSAKQSSMCVAMIRTHTHRHTHTHTHSLATHSLTHSRLASRARPDFHFLWRTGARFALGMRCRRSIVVSSNP